MKKDWIVASGLDIFHLSKERCSAGNQPSDFPCVELDCLSQGTGEIISTINISKVKGVRNRFSKGQVLYGKLRPYLNKYARPRFDGACSTEIWVIDTKDKTKLLQEYLFYLVQSVQFRDAASATSGTKMPRASWEIVKSANFDLPPLVEQGWIAKILSDADAVISTMENLARQLNEQFIGFRNQAMKHIAEKTDTKSLLGDLAKIPQLEAISSAKNKNPLELSLYCKGIKINSARKIRLSASGRPYFQRRNGDFLIGRQSIHMGGFGFVTPELDGGIASNAITTLRLNPKKINGRFFLHYFSRPCFYRRLEALMDGTAQKEMHEAKIKRIEIPLPDMQTQNEIASAIDGHLRAYQLQQKLAAALKKQKRGLMQQLLTGKLRVNSKNKERKKP